SSASMERDGPESLCVQLVERENEAWREGCGRREGRKPGAGREEEGTDGREEEGWERRAGGGGSREGGLCEVEEISQTWGRSFMRSFQPGASRREGEGGEGEEEEEEEDPSIEVKLVEVKSKNDFLSPHQEAWICELLRDEKGWNAEGGGEAGREGGRKGGREAGAKGGTAAPPTTSFELCHVRSV
ncbi:VRR-NUC domain protein, partial [Nannochloropsis gaditana]